MNSEKYKMHACNNEKVKASSLSIFVIGLDSNIVSLKKVNWPYDVLLTKCKKYVKITL